MNAISSTFFAMFGNNSETSMPLWPYFLNVNGLGIRGPGKPWRTTTSPWPVIGWPAYLSSIGFGSNVSTWLTPPLMNSEITALARGLKWGGFGARGEAGRAEAGGGVPP